MDDYVATFATRIDDCPSISVLWLESTPTRCVLWLSVYSNVSDWSHLVEEQYIPRTFHSSYKYNTPEVDECIYKRRSFEQTCIINMHTVKVLFSSLQFIELNV